MSYEYIKTWRNKMRKHALDAFGGECGICGYRKCTQALEFHHVSPSEKDFSIGSSNIANWSKIVVELRKCVMVCTNCHRELHYGYAKIEDVRFKFDESYANWVYDETHVTYCKKCGNANPFPTYKYCSPKCRESLGYKVDWTNIDLPNLLSSNSYEAIGRMFNVTGAAVKKRAKKLALV